MLRSRLRSTNGTIRLALAILISFILISANGAPDKKLCSSSCASSFSNQQREQLCRGENADNIAAAQCANEAKSKLGNFKVDDIIALCKGVDSQSGNPTAPVQCLSMYMASPADKNNRAMGVELCSNVTSIVPVECWMKLKPHMKEIQHSVKPSNSLSGSRGSSGGTKKYTAHDVLSYCRNEVFDLSVLGCINAAAAPSTVQHKLTPSQMSMGEVLQSCAEISGNILLEEAAAESDTAESAGTGSGSSNGSGSGGSLGKVLSPTSMEFCLAEMLAYTGSGKSTGSGKAGAGGKQSYSSADIVNFCADSSMADSYHQLQRSLVEAASQHTTPSVASASVSSGVVHSLDCFVTLDSFMKQAPSGSTYKNLLTRSMIGNVCRGSKVPNGAASCAIAGISDKTYVHGSGSKTGMFGGKISAQYIEELCQLARGTGPIDCYDKAGVTGTINTGSGGVQKNLNVDSIKVDLCTGANGTGPVDCFHHATTTVKSPVLKNDVSSKLMLCNGAASVAPSVCAVESPSYLNIDEKIRLCKGRDGWNGGTGSGSGGSNSMKQQSTAAVDPTYALAPVQCLKIVEQLYKNFVNAPNKALGVGLSPEASDAKNRAGRFRLLRMCSYAASDAPLQTAYCFKNAPNSLQFNDAIHMCTNVTSPAASSASSGAAANGASAGGVAAASVSGAASAVADEMLLNMKMCLKLLEPKGWKSHEIMILCGSTDHLSRVAQDHSAESGGGKGKKSNPQQQQQRQQQKQHSQQVQQSNINSIVKCAQYVHNALLYSKLEAAYICREEVTLDTSGMNKAQQQHTGGSSGVSAVLATGGPVMQCAGIAVPSPTSTIGSSGSLSTGSMKRIPAIVLRDVCSATREIAVSRANQSSIAGTGYAGHIAAAASFRSIAQAETAGKCLVRLYGHVATDASVLNQLNSLSGADLSAPASDANIDVDREFSEQIQANSLVSDICTSSAYASQIACIQQLPGKFPSRDDVQSCIQQQFSQPSSVRVLRIHSHEDNDIEITAGRPFSIWLQMVDQWGVDISHDSRLSAPTQSQQQQQQQSTPSTMGLRVQLSLNENNEQGAVLWGITSNYTVSTTAAAGSHAVPSHFGGRIELNNVIVSVPGPLQFIFTTSPAASTSSAGTSSRAGGRAVLGVYGVRVKEDPTRKDTAFCTFVFKRAMCAADRSEEEHESDFPMTRHWLPMTYYQHILVCDALLTSWFVGAHFNNAIVNGGQAETSVGGGGGIWIQHRIGIAAIWLGGVGGAYNDEVALPRVEQSHYERLGLQDPDSAGDSRSSKRKALSKRDIKRAYYKKSIIWHPDKWASLTARGASGSGSSSATSGGVAGSVSMPSPYTELVQTIFELVGEAYRVLSEQNDSD